MKKLLAAFFGCLIACGALADGLPGFISNTLTWQSSSFTRPANTTAYAQNQLIASSTTAGTIIVPSFRIATSAAGACFQRIRLFTNVTTGWDTATFAIRFWYTAPTYTNGDGGAYLPATGAAQFLGTFVAGITQYGDGASGEGVPVNLNPVCVPGNNTNIFWDIQYSGSAARTPISGQTFTLIADTMN